MIIHAGQAVRRRRRGQEGPGRGQGPRCVQQSDAEQGRGHREGSAGRGESSKGGVREGQIEDESDEKTRTAPRRGDEGLRRMLIWL